MKFCRNFVNVFGNLKTTWRFADFFQRTHVTMIDLVKSSPKGIYYLLAKISFDKAENEPSKVCQKAVRQLFLVDI